MSEKRKLTIGKLAHVDAGKTTLSEAILFKTGAIRSSGRVDKGDAFMDRDEQERRRGITIFTGQAEFVLPAAGSEASGQMQGPADVILLDTPGHVDFSAEMERTLGVLDYAILVISGKEGVQGHTITLWKLLERYNVPCFIFINKMDMEGTDRDAILSGLQEKLDSGCRELCSADPEELAMCDENLLEEYLETGELSQGSIAKAVKARNLFPCFFGSALKMQGIDEFIYGISGLAIGYGQDAQEDLSKEELKYKVFRITRDRQGERLSHMKILSGCLKVRESIEGEKVNQIRIISGEKYRLVEEAGPGSICAVTGPAELKIKKGYTEAVMSYGLILPEGINVHETYKKFKQLEEEDPQLHLTWNEQKQEIQARLMGQVQLEVLQQVILNRFGMEVEFGEGSITYKETIRKPVEGAGHYEPLRHYAEVHLALEPLPRGKGLKFRSPVSHDELDTNWQRLIMTHLMEREHPGTLTGSPITDMKISILAGKAHDKHTEGGDFRQSTYRAIRQGLRKSLAAGDMILLEPWYEYELEVPQDMIGRAMSDIQRMGGSFQPPEMADDAGTALLKGKAPVSEMKDYITEVASYTKGFGHLSCSFAGYEECHNQDEVVKEVGYDPDRDTANPADSVFCQHGAGRMIPWNESDEMMHVSSGWNPEGDQMDEEGGAENAAAAAGRAAFAGGSAGGGGAAFADDKELQRIFDRTFKPSEKKRPMIEARVIKPEPEKRKLNMGQDRNLPECLLVDGYNIIFAWPELNELAKVNIDAAREALVEILANYQGFRKCRVIAVFDAYRVKGGRRHIEQQGDVTVVYTAEAETADTYIERTSYELAGKRGSGSQKYRVRVATSDRLEQMIIMGNNAQRLSATDFRGEVEAVNAEIAEYMKQLQRKNRLENPNRLEIPGVGNEE